MRTIAGGHKHGRARVQTSAQKLRLVLSLLCVCLKMRATLLLVISALSFLRSDLHCLAHNLLSSFSLLSKLAVNWAFMDCVQIN